MNTIPQPYRIEVGPWLDFADTEAERINAEIVHAGFASASPPRCVSARRLYWIAGDLSWDQVQAASAALLADPVTETFAVNAALPAPDNAGIVIEVLKKPGVMDPLVGHWRKALHDRGLSGLKLASGRQYLFDAGVAPEEAAQVARRLLANETIEDVCVNQAARPRWIEGQAPFKLIVVPLKGLGDDALRKLSQDGCLSLTVAEMRMIQAYFDGLGRPPTDAELETIAQTWSEHCRHKTLLGQVELQVADQPPKSFASLLKETIVQATREINHPACLSVFKDNAGVVAFDDQWALTFKVETHNHPSAIEPYGGAATGIGGCIRDTLGTGLGAKPIANTDVFCFGPPELPWEALPPGALHPRRILNGVVAGVRDYGNRMGIPTVNGAVHFDPRYVGNPLVFCGSVGLIPRDKIEKKAHPGELVVVLGGRTGRDGIHGATFSSVELTSESETVSSGAVQIGNPIEEKKILDALLRARDEGLYSCVTDCGAGGLSSAAGEMGQEIGVEIELERVPLKYEGLTYTEIWISEAQERMVLAVPPDKWPRLQALCAEEDVEATAIGEFKDHGQLVLRYAGQEVGRLDMAFLHDGLPKIVRQASFSAPREAPFPLERLDGSPLDDLLKLLGCPTIASKEWIVRQYDHEVQGRTVLKPLTGARDDGPADAAVMAPLLGQTRGFALGNGLCPQFTERDPVEMAKLAIDEALRNVVAVGADPDQAFILDNFAWGNTAKPEQLGSLALACEGALEAARAFGTPFISGKDSLNNEYRVDGKPIAIPGTLLISALAIVPDVRRCVTMDLKPVPGAPVFLLGDTQGALGGSHVGILHGLPVTAGLLPRVNLVRAKALYRALFQAIQAGHVLACHDLSEGGLAVAAAEMAFAGETGLNLDLARLGSNLATRVLLFEESPSRLLVQVQPDRADAFAACFSNLPCRCVGTSNASVDLTIHHGAQRMLEAPLAELKTAWGATHA